MSQDIRAAGLRKVYDHGTIQALGGVDLELGNGEFVAIIGRSGSGKSTLLHLLGGLDRPDSGVLHICGRSIRGRSDRSFVRQRCVGFVFQMHGLLPCLTAARNVEVPMFTTDRTRRERRQRVSLLLGSLGIDHLASRRPQKLSGGERQRVSIARALANDPRILLADEPTGNLDVETGREVLGVMKELNRNGLTLVVVTHDPEVAGLADRSVELRDGIVVERRENETRWMKATQRV